MLQFYLHTLNFVLRSFCFMKGSKKVEDVEMLFTWCLETKCGFRSVEWVLIICEAETLACTE